MTRSELIAALARRNPHLSLADVDLAARRMLSQLGDALAQGERIEIRGFGTFSVRYRKITRGAKPEDGSSRDLGGALRASLSPEHAISLEAQP